LRFGVRVPNDGPLVSPSNMKRLATAAEELGYDSVLVHDHILVPDPSWNPFFDPLVSLTYLAALTERIRLGTSVFLLPLRTPVIFAKQIATLDQISGGRAFIGVGVGYLKEEYESVGVPFAKRGKIADEYLLALKELWTKPKTTVRGEFTNLKEIESEPKPLQKPHPPIWVGGGSEAATIRAVRYGNGRHALGGPDVVKAEVERVKRHATILGRDLRDFDVIVEPWVSIGHDVHEAVAKALATPLVRQRSKGADELVRSNLVGTFEEIFRQVSVFREAGATYVQLRFVSERNSLDETLKMMKQFSEWLPRLI
jgi:probable F420-dependent oxidoreductase